MIKKLDLDTIKLVEYAFTWWSAISESSKQKQLEAEDVYFLQVTLLCDYDKVY